MLKGIPTILSPELFKILLEMGHGDELVITDGNFPAATCAKRLVRCDGHGAPELLDAIMRFFPLDTFVPKPVSLMAVVPGDDYVPEIWKDYAAIIGKYDKRAADFNMVERFEFYERAKKAFAVVYTSESARYANIILQKGVL